MEGHYGRGAGTFLTTCGLAFLFTYDERRKHKSLPSLTKLSVKRLVRMVAGRVPLPSRIPDSIANFVCSVSVKALRKRRSCGSNKRNHVYKAQD